MWYVSCVPCYAVAAARLTDAKASAAPVWMPDRAVTRCSICNASFNVLNRRHHCRMCGAVVCKKNSMSRKLLRNINQKDAVRVCDRCVMGNSEGKHNYFRMQVRVSRAKNLPSVDRSHQPDPFVRVFCGSQLEVSGASGGAFPSGGRSPCLPLHLSSSLFVGAL